MGGAGEIDLGKESFKGIIANAIIAIAGFLGVIIFTRTIDKSHLGGYYLLLSLVLLVNRPVLGICRAANKRWSELGSQKSQILGGSLILCTLWVILVTLAALVLQQELLNYIGFSGSANAFILMVVSLTFYFSYQKLIGALGYPSKQLWVDAVRSLTALPLQLILAIGGLGALGLGYGYAGAAFVMVPVSAFIIRTEIKTPNKETIRSLWSYARFSIPNAVLGKAYERFDILLLGALIGTAPVADYEVALRLTVPALFISSSITTGLLPKISNKSSKEESVASEINKSISYTSIISIPIFFGSLAIPNLLVETIFGETYHSAAPYLIGLALYQVITTQSAIYRTALDGLNMPSTGFRISLITLFINIVFGVMFVFQFGAIGVVLATIIAEISQYLMAMYPIYKIENIYIIPHLLKVEIASGILMFIFVKILRMGFPGESVIILISLIFIGVLSYFGSLIMLSPQIKEVIYKLSN